MFHKKKCKAPLIKKEKKTKKPHNNRKFKKDIQQIKEYAAQQSLGNQEVIRLFHNSEIQAKLYINQPGDIYEQEADRVAEKIADTSNSEIKNESGQIKIQKKAAMTGGRSVLIQTESEINALKGKGLPMRKQVRDYFESRFGVDLGNVRIHKESNADRLARAIRARAFTLGNNIVFARNEYEPDTKAGKKLLAHELTHVIQQGSSDEIQRFPNPRDCTHYLPNSLTEIKLPVVKDGYNKSVNTKLKNPLTFWDWDYRWQVYDSMDQLIYEATKPIGYFELTREIVNKGVAGGKGKPWSIWIKVNRTAAFWDTANDTYFPHSFITFNVYDTWEECIKDYKEITFQSNEQTSMEFQGIKDKIFLLDQDLINMFKDNSGISWCDVANVGLFGLGGLLVNKIRSDIELNYINEELKKKGLSLEALYKVILLFQQKVVSKAELMIMNNLKIVRDEYKRYQNKNELNALLSKLTTTYATDFDEADLLRAKALRRCVAENNIKKALINSLPKDPMSLIIVGGLNFLLTVHSDAEVAEFLSQQPPDLAEMLTYIIVTLNSNPLLLGTLTFTSPSIQSHYPEFQEAKEMDNTTIELMRSKDVEKFPILADVHIDFRSMSRQYRKNSDGFKEKIESLLRESESAGIKTLQTLKESPEKVWELIPLIQLTMTAEKISKDDKIGQLIWDRVTDIQRENTIRSLALAAVGIALGIAGFFTGGATWAALALGAGGAIVSGIDLYFELESYILLSNASRATLGGELSDDPGILGITLAILGLVIDIVDIGVAGFKMIKESAEAIDAASEMTKAGMKQYNEMAETAAKQYDELQGAGLIRKGVTKPEFIEKITKATTKLDNAKLSHIAPELYNKLLKHMDDVPDLMQYGLGSLFKADPGICTKLIDDFAESPSVLARLSNHVLINEDMPESFARIYELLGDTKAKEVLEYFGREGAAIADELPYVVNSLDNIGVTDSKIVQEILTNSRKSKVFSEMLNKDQYKILDDLYKNLPSPQGRKTIAGTSDGTKIYSGYGAVDSNDFTITKQVLNKENEIGHTIRGSYTDAKIGDTPLKGSYYACHAEKKMSILAPNKPIVIKGPSTVCFDCEEYFIKLAKYTNKPQIIVNTKNINIFIPGEEVLKIPK
ncbi:MAG: DUF4157 domain-containing protein [Spirochaetales bacterium]|nr:DUF4157 domain-containing protein [Spirochaetales bacterium]